MDCYFVTKKLPLTNGKQELYYNIYIITNLRNYRL